MKYQDNLMGMNPFIQSAFIYLVLVGCLVALIGCTVSSVPNVDSRSSQAPRWLVFHGAWFEITYPADFTPVPSLASSTTAGYDSAEFISPDGSVSFYVYAPQWGGEPTDIVLDTQRESLVSEKRAEQMGREVHWLTICAKDREYCRTYQDTMEKQGAIRTTLGIKYRDEEARSQYRQEYLKFQHSLQQFAD